MTLTIRPSDQPTDQPTDIVIYRAAIAAKYEMEFATAEIYSGRDTLKTSHFFHCIQILCDTLILKISAHPVELCFHLQGHHQWSEQLIVQEFIALHLLCILRTSNSQLN